MGARTGRVAWLSRRLHRLLARQAVVLRGAAVGVHRHLFGVCIAGSVELGDRVVVGGQVGFADNLKIGNDVVFVARSGVHSDSPDRSVYMGMPAVPYMEHFKKDKAMKRLPRKTEKLEEQVKILEEKIKQLEDKLGVGV